MEKKAVWLIIFIVSSISFVYASEFGYDNSNLPRIEPSISTSSNINYSTVNVNNSLYWQGHIWSEVSPYLYNFTIETYNLYNAIWISSYNSTYDTWLSNYTLYNKFWYNMTYSGSTYNYTYATWAYNQTYSGSTYNSTYSSYAYNQTVSAISDINNRFWNKTQSYNKTEIENNLTNKLDLRTGGDVTGNVNASGRLCANSVCIGTPLFPNVIVPKGVTGSDFHMNWNAANDSTDNFYNFYVDDGKRTTLFSVVGSTQAVSSGPGYFSAGSLRIKGTDTSNTIYNGARNLMMTSDSGYVVGIGKVSAPGTGGVVVNTTNGYVSMGTAAINYPVTISYSPSVPQSAQFDFLNLAMVLNGNNTYDSIGRGVQGAYFNAQWLATSDNQDIKNANAWYLLPQVNGQLKENFTITNIAAIQLYPVYTVYSPRNTTNITNAYGILIKNGPMPAVGNYSNQYGIYLQKLSSFKNNYELMFETSGGAYFRDSNINITSQADGYLDIEADKGIRTSTNITTFGSLNATSITSLYKSADGTSGITDATSYKACASSTPVSVCVDSGCGSPVSIIACTDDCTLQIKNGLVTGCV